MGVIIKSIELSNWFSYRGKYEENKFEFKDGINIIVAANDIGKSKLHNAFRWILNDNVILKITDITGEEKYGLVTLNEEVLNDPDKSFFNFSRANLLTNGETETLGVKLTYTETKSNNETTTRTLQKEVKIKKDVNRLIIVETTTRVIKNDNGAIRTAPEAFDELIKRVIRPILMDFFLVQGESLEFLTPLKGERLKTTINNLVNLTKLDESCNRSIQYANHIKTLRGSIEGKEHLARGVNAELVQKKATIENTILAITNEDIPALESNLTEFKKTRDKFRDQATTARVNQTHATAIETYAKQINELEGATSQQFKTLVDNYINKEFWISKITPVAEEKEKLKKISSQIREFSAERRTELDNSLTEKEQKMLFALEKDQPGLAILNQMLEDDTCFVCSTSLNDSSKKYIKEKLIPFFKNELNNNDDELNKLTELNEMFRKFDSFLFKFNEFNEDFFVNKLEDIAENINNKRKISKEKETYIRENGSTTINDNALISLSTYDQAILQIKQIEEKIKVKRAKLRELEDELVKTSTSISNDIPDEEDSPKLKTAKNLEIFNNDLKNFLIEIKKNTYQLFSTQLEASSNEKFKAISVNNEKFKDQQIKVDFNLGANNEPNFEIKVVNKSGHSMNQGGGASQVLRQLSVIFGLIDKAGGSVDYPFIADAPTDKMSSSLTKDFFKYQLEKATNQNILITKELWDDESNQLNILGLEILENIASKQNSRLIVLKYQNDNSKRVEIINKN